MRREHFTYDRRQVVFAGTGTSVFHHRRQGYDASSRRADAINHPAIEGLRFGAQYLSLTYVVHLQEIEARKLGTRKGVVLERDRCYGSKGRAAFNMLAGCT